jgi:hypothetical protein
MWCLCLELRISSWRNVSLERISNVCTAHVRVCLTYPTHTSLYLPRDAQINVSAIENGHTRLWWVFDLLIKYVLPVVLPALMLSAFLDDLFNNKHGYMDYPLWLQVGDYNGLLQMCHRGMCMCVCVCVCVRASCCLWLNKCKASAKYKHIECHCDCGKSGLAVVGIGDEMVFCCGLYLSTHLPLFLWSHSQMII